MDTSSEHPSEHSAPALGARAPDFTLSDDAGKAHRLSEELRLGKTIILIFMRGEW